jgi:microcystin-dependent protein
MSQAQFTIPLITVIPGQLITANLWNNEFLNIQTNLNPLGIGAYMDTTPQAQIQTAPYPSSILSLATSLGGEIERLRYQLAAITGNTYWYQAPSVNVATAANILLPLGGVIDYHSATPPNANFLLANGQAIGRSAYAALNTLYSGASYPFGNGDGSTTFNLPNYTDRVPIAAGNLYAVAATGGEATHVLSSTEVPATSVAITDPGHVHAVTDPGHIHNVATDDLGGTGTNSNVISAVRGVTKHGDYPFVESNTTGVTVNSHTTGVTAAVSGGGGAHNNLPPYISMYKLIRVL